MSFAGGHVPEADWKVFRRLRVDALERFCGNVLNRISELAAEPGKSKHERYLAVFEEIERSERQLAMAFDDPRRSRMIEQLRIMVGLGLIDDEELGELSEDTRHRVQFF
ncbi:MAG TPA: hypothetical protein VF210_16860 [Pseudomonadales bacterium]